VQACVLTIRCFFRSTGAIRGGPIRGASLRGASLRGALGGIAAQLHGVAVVLVAVMVAAPFRPGFAAEPAEQDSDRVTLVFNQQTTLDTFITLVSKELGINIIYRAEAAKQPVVMRSPSSVGREDLFPLLQRILQVHDLALVPTEVNQTWRLVASEQAAVTPMEQREGQGTFETRLLRVRHAGVDAAAEVASQLASKPAGRVVKVPETRMIVVSDYAENVARIANLLEAADVEPDMRQRIYRLEHVSPQQTRALIEDLAPDEGRGQSVLVAADPQMRVLVVRGPEHVLANVDALIAAVDVKPADAERPVRFYKLRNVQATDVLATLRALEGQNAAAASGFPGLPGFSGFPGVGSLGGGTAVGPEPRGPLFGPESEAAQEGESSPRERGVIESRQAAAAGGRDAEASGGAGASGFSTVTQARVAADVQTNSIIVIAPPEEQRVYEAIIQNLDHRRPQVLIETTIVSLDTSDDFTLGVEIGTAREGDDGRIITFSAFGLSEIDIDEDSFTQLPVPAIGGNFAVLAPDIANVVIQALATNTRSKLVSMPRVLVNDNETGVLSSVTEQPFQRTVITGDTTIVGEGNFATAGTEISLTASISEGDYLQLDYAVELSNFVGAAQENLPPPAQRNQVSSRVTIPDGYTIVVGGLNQSNFRETLQKVPLLGDIPVIQHLFRSTTTSGDNTTLFVFIRPTIFRDPVFADLTAESDRDLNEAGLSPNYPLSDPVILDPATQWK